MIAWLLEELSFNDKPNIYERENTALAPPAFNVSCGTSWGKTPIYSERMLMPQLSGAISDYVFLAHFNSRLPFWSLPARANESECANETTQPNGPLLPNGVYSTYSCLYR